MENERIQRLVEFLQGTEAGEAVSFYPADLRALFTEVNMRGDALAQATRERDEARTTLAHVADKLDSLLEGGEIDYLTRVGLSILRLEARVASKPRGGEGRVSEREMSINE